jgi:predicted RNase H-like HicB family nuclease
MKESARYVKIVEWSDEDECFVGQCPGVIGPRCHGADEQAVYAELCQIVDEWIEVLHKDGNPLPPATAVKVFEGDQDAVREHFVEVESERQRQLHERDGQDAE